MSGFQFPITLTIIVTSSIIDNKTIIVNVTRHGFVKRY
jgi:hypothetical protein